jgi:D-glycero-alpha-D-manno-heptose 1-phosphate guanylyltransferase
VANGDSLVFANPLPLLDALRLVNTDAALLGLQIADAGRFGTLEINAQSRLTAFREKRPGAGTINAGVYAFNGAALLRQPPQRPLSFEIDVFPALASSGRVAVVSTEAPFLDIGTPETLAEAERFIAQNHARFLS